MSPLLSRLALLGRTRLSLDHVEPRERERMLQMGALVVDRRRVRPRYFDGRFLAARDLGRDQEYFLTRQRELARLAGAGVLAGLEVSLVSDTCLSLSPGAGITEAGDLVVVPDVNPETPEQEGLRIELSDMPTIQRLSFDFGLLDAPNRPTRRPTGLFALALRPVEYTANPVGSYPASLTEGRTAEDAEIIEAAAVTLIPLGDDFAEDDADLRRALVARSVFLGERESGTPAEALPLAVLQLDAGTIRWVDAYMIRREVGPEHTGVAGMGLASRALAEAFALQYQAHLADLLEARRADGQDMRFTAASAFQALPPAGPLPAATVDLDTGTQIWFPPGVATAVVQVPPDEIALLVEEGLLLPPLDLTAGTEELATVSVLILSPRPREAGGTTPSPVPLPPQPTLLPQGGSPLLGARPTSSLTGGAALGATTLGGLVTRGFPVSARLPALAGRLATRAALDASEAGEIPTLWYVRCRTMHVAPDAEPVPPVG